MIELYNNCPIDLHSFDEDFDSDCNYISFISIFLAGISYNVLIKNKQGEVCFDFKEHVEHYGYGNINYPDIPEFVNIYHDALVNDYFINNLNIRTYFKLACKDSKEFKKELILQENFLTINENNNK